MTHQYISLSIVVHSRNFNVAKSTKMLRETLEWRKQFDFGKLYSEDKDIIANENATGKMYVRGFDKEGSALIYMKSANENTKDHTGNIKHLVYSMERAIACMDARGEGNTKISLVIEFGGLTSAHMPPMKTSKETLSILQNHYPERLKCAYTLRAPFIFHAFFRMISPFIDPVTKKKICMIKNSEVGQDSCRLYQEVDRETLETSVSGLDDRPFVSSVYLAAPFDQEYKGILDASSDAAVQAVAAAVEELKVATPDAPSAAAAAEEDAPDLDLELDVEPVTVDSPTEQEVVA